MLVTLAAIQLLALGQAKVGDVPEPTPPPQDGAAQPTPQGAAPEAPPPAAQPPAANAPPAASPATPPPASPPAPAPAPTKAGKAAQAPYPSLLSASSLQGGSAALAWFGWSSFGALWGEGVTKRDDLGAQLTFDWSTTELRLGGWYRRPLGSAGAFDIAGRLALSWYADFGTHWAQTGNKSDRGFELAPALLASAPGAGGVFSVAGELPMAVTVYRSGGFFVHPNLWVAYETPLYDPVSVGVRAGIGYRAGSGDAPMKTGRTNLEFLLLAGYRLF